ncbi:MAG: hypothetical protein FWE06_00460 [Oscillospiraceae bacterium]|nr:hypothetical protein [Oscillospiraceae bacterium]
MPTPQIAPDYSRFERRQIVVEPEVPLELLEEEQALQAPKKIIEKTRIPYKVLAAFAVVAALLVAVIFSYNRMWTVNAENLRLERALQALQMEEQALLQEFAGGLTIHEITAEARGIGMLPPAPDQVVHVNLGGQDRAVVYTQEGFLERIWNWVTGLFG